MDKSLVSKSKNLIQNLAIFFLVILISKIFLIYFYGNATPFWDQWSAEAENLYLRWLNGHLNFSGLIETHNEHRIFTMRVLSLGLFFLNGKIWNPLLEMYVNSILHIASLTIFLYFVTKSIIEKYQKYLIIFSIALFIVPFGWENTLAGFQSQFYLLLLFSFIFFWAICFEEIFTLKWWGGIIAGILCPLSLASGTLTFFMGAIILFVRRYFFPNTGLKPIFVGLALIVLGVISLYYTPVITDHAVLKAHNLKEFFEGLFKAAAWPLKSPQLAVLVQSPIVIFTGFLFLKKEWRTQQSYFFLLAVGGWGFSQFISIAYGRHSGLLSSRYLDLFAIGLIVNFSCCLIFLGRSSNKLKRLLKFCIALWLIVVVIGIFSKLTSMSNELNEKKLYGLAQEKNVRAYLCTGDISHITDKPHLHVPFPDVIYLKKLLDNPLIRAILPGNIMVDNAKKKVNSDGSPFCDYEMLPSAFKLSELSILRLDQLTSQSNIIFEGWRGTDFLRSNIKGIKVVGSYVNDDSDMGTLKFRLKRGDGILFRSGPRTTKQIILIDDGLGRFSTTLPICPEWQPIIFSNPDLPSEFVVTIIDAGSAWGEWSAVGFKDKG